MDYLKKEYGCFTSDDRFMVPECFRAVSAQFTDKEKYISLVIEGQSLLLSASTNIDSDRLILVDRHGNIEISKQIRQEAGMTNDCFTAFLTALDTIRLTSLNFLKLIHRSIRNPITIT